MTHASGPEDDPPKDDGRDVAESIEAMNAALADWAARSASDSDALIERFEAMGYEVRGKSEAEVADVLRHPPTRPPA